MLTALRSLLGGTVVRVIVGSDREEFSIHMARLKQTSFFEVHGLPGEQVDIAQLRTTTNAGTDLESAAEQTIKSEVATPQNAAALPNETRPDYIIAPENKIAAQAWSYFAQWLYNSEVPEINDRKTIKIALLAYNYARQYQAWQLQNILVDRFKRHYLVHKVQIDELTYLTNKFGDDPNGTPLTRYVLEQISHDIAVRGFNDFSSDNTWLDMFLKEGDRITRHAMFAILARHASTACSGSGGIKDPAENMSREWKVTESGEDAGYWLPRAFSDK